MTHILPLNYTTRELLHTKKRKDDTCDHLKAVLGDKAISCEIEKVGPEITSSSQEPSFFSDGIAEDLFNAETLHESKNDTIAFKCPSITMDNMLSPSHTLVQVICQDHKGLLYDVMRTLKDCDIQVSTRSFILTNFCLPDFLMTNVRWLCTRFATGAWRGKETPNASSTCL